jgi:hypothetical protein
VNAGVEDRQDVGVAERGNSLRLALEARPPGRLVSEARGQHLDRHIALQPGVTGTINFTHASGPEKAENLVRSDPGAGIHRVAIVANINLPLREIQITR